MSTITAAMAELVFEINQSTLRNWVERGHVRKYGRDRYDLDDVRERYKKLVARDIEHLGPSSGQPLA